MSVVAVIVILLVLFLACTVFLFAFAQRLGVTERTRPDMFLVILSFAGVATAVFAVVWFFAHRN